MPMSADLAKVQRTRGAVASFKVYLESEKARFEAALAAAMAGGATAAQLAPIRAELDVTVQEAEAMAAAIVANPAPGDPVPPESPVPPGPEPLRR